MAVMVHKAHHPLYYDLAGIVGPSYVSDDDYTLETYSKDTSPLPPNKQGIVVRPVNTDQVVDIVKLANITKIPIVPSGGRASFYGTSKGLHGKGIVIDMTRMNKMLIVDEVNLTATAEAGMTTSEFTTRLWDMKWDTHTAWQPFYPDTLGGQISGFCGGGNGLEMAYAGFNASHIPSVKVVLPDASIVETGAGAGNNIHNTIHYDRYPGNPDLTGLFMGDAGTFGIKVEATYRLYKLSPHKNALAFYYDTLEGAWDAVQEVSIVEPLPYCTVAMMPLTKFSAANHKQEKNMVIMIIKGWTEKEVKAKEEIVEEIHARHKGVVAVGPGPEDWKKSALIGRRAREMGEMTTGGAWTFFEYSVSRSQLLDCQRTIDGFVYKKLDEAGIFYHTHEGIVPSGSCAWIKNLTVFTRGDDKRSQEVMRDLFTEATELAVSRGWYTDCHQGFGSRAMAKHWPKHHYDFMKKLKSAVDPNNIMNPGVWDF